MDIINQEVDKDHQNNILNFKNKVNFKFFKQLEELILLIN